MSSNQIDIESSVGVNSPLIGKEEIDIESSVGVNSPLIGKEEIDTNRSYKSPSPFQKYSKYWIIIGGILGICSVVAFVTVLVVSSHNTKQHIFPFENIFDPDYAIQTFSPQWLANGSGNYFISQDDQNNIIATTLSEDGTAVTKTLLYASDLMTFEDPKISLSDGKFILLAVNVEHIYRHSYLADYLVWNVEEKSYRFLTDPVKGKLQLAVWNPNDNTVAFVRDNDIYLTNASTKDVAPEYRISSNGSDVILNGVFSWAYEEEIFEDRVAMWWSPDGNKLAWLHTDQDPVGISTLPHYEEDLIYSEFKHFHYPKPGYDISKCEVQIWDNASNATSSLLLHPGEHYITFVGWEDTSNRLILRRLERSQSLESFWAYSLITHNVNQIYSNITSSTWIDTFPPVLFQNDEKNYLAHIIDHNGRYQLAVVETTEEPQQAKILSQMTSDVNGILGYNAENDWLYYTAITNFSTPAPVSQSIFKVHVLTSQDPVLVSEPKEGFNVGTLSPNADYYLLAEMGPDIPSFSMVDAATGVQYILGNNSKLVNLMKNFSLPYKEFFKIQVPTDTDPDEPVTLYGYILKPPALREADKYPCLFNPYGGPYAQMVTSAYYRDFYLLYLASQGYVIIVIDGRGTGGRGTIFEKQVHKMLGDFAVKDQLSAGSLITDVFPFIDKEKIAIWGWSFGGYVASGVMSNGSDIFSLGVATAPVTDWRYYDGVYTERYMSTPSLNSQGYYDTSILPRAHNIKKDFMLIHGTGDDNVHFMNSALLNERLVEANIMFRAMYYVNRNHSINGNNARPHIYQLIYQYLEEKLK